MDLGHHIHQALEATRHLEATLAAGDLVRGAALLEDRERSLVTLAEAHGASSERERSRYRHLIEELVQADENLRTLADRNLADTAAEMARAPLAQHDGAEPLTACLDRKA